MWRGSQEGRVRAQMVTKIKRLCFDCKGKQRDEGYVNGWPNFSLLFIYLFKILPLPPFVFVYISWQKLKAMVLQVQSF